MMFSAMTNDMYHFLAESMPITADNVTNSADDINASTSMETFAVTPQQLVDNSAFTATESNTLNGQVHSIMSNSVSTEMQTTESPDVTSEESNEAKETVTSEGSRSDDVIDMGISLPADEELATTETESSNNASCVSKSVSVGTDEGNSLPESVALPEVHTNLDGATMTMKYSETDVVNENVDNKEKTKEKIVVSAAETEKVQPIMYVSTAELERRYGPAATMKQLKQNYGLQNQNMAPGTKLMSVVKPITVSGGGKIVKLTRTDGGKLNVITNPSTMVVTPTGTKVGAATSGGSKPMFIKPTAVLQGPTTGGVKQVFHLLKSSDLKKIAKAGGVPTVHEKFFKAPGKSNSSRSSVKSTDLSNLVRVFPNPLLNNPPNVKLKIMKNMNKDSSARNASPGKRSTLSTIDAGEKDIVYPKYEFRNTNKTPETQYKSKLRSTDDKGVFSLVDYLAEEGSSESDEIVDVKPDISKKTRKKDKDPDFHPPKQSYYNYFQNSSSNMKRRSTEGRGDEQKKSKVDVPVRVKQEPMSESEEGGGAGSKKRGSEKTGSATQTEAGSGKGKQTTVTDENEAEKEPGEQGTDEEGMMKVVLFFLAYISFLDS